MRGVTPVCAFLALGNIFLLTRLMRGVTGRGGVGCYRVGISTHTPHARRDTFGEHPAQAALHFYSHASCEA